MENFNDFLAWEQASRDTVDFKKVYVDVTGDLVAGLLLSQIIYWHLPDKKGRSKLRVFKQNKYWLAKQRSEWWEEIRISPKQYDCAIKKLEEKGIVEVWNTMFNGKRTPHIHLHQDNLVLLMKSTLKQSSPGSSTVLPNGEYRCSPNVETGVAETGIPITETTAQTTTKIIRNKEYKGFPLDEIKPLSFSDYFELYGYKNADIVKAVDYYVQQYREYIGKEHPNLKPEQWQRVEDYIMSFEGEYSSDDIDLAEIEQIIDKHFITEYADGCDYNILHFVSGDIIKNRFYEECY